MLLRKTSSAAAAVPSNSIIVVECPIQQLDASCDRSYCSVWLTFRSQYPWSPARRPLELGASGEVALIRTGV